MKEDNRNKNIIRNIGKDIFIYIPSMLLPVFFGFIALSVYTRLFTPEEYGDYALTMNTVSIFGIVSFGWLNQSNLRFYSKYKNTEFKKYISTSYFSLIGTLILSISLIYIFTFGNLMPRSVGNHLGLVIAILISNSSLETLLSILRADRKAKMVSIIRVATSFLYLLISLIFIYIFNLGVSSLFLSIITGNLISSGIIISQHNFIKFVHVKEFSWDLFKEFYRYGVPVATILIFSWILMVSDQFILEYFKGNHEVGIYSATYNLASYPMSLVSTLIITAAFPIIIDTWENNFEDDTKTVISAIIRYYLIIAIPSLVGIIILSKEIMLILGSAYSSGYIALPWICFGSIIYGLCIYVNKGFELKKNTKILAFLVGIAGISNIIMNIFLIPKYGYYGAAVSTSISYLIYLIIGIYSSKKDINWTIVINFHSIKNVIIASLLMGITLIIIKENTISSFLNMVILICLGIGIYLLSLFTIKEINNEVAFFKNFLNSEVENR